MIKTLKNRVAFLAMKSAKIEKLNVSRGNKKLISNDHVSFLIWNLPAKLTCPGGTTMCKLACYAVKAELAYPTVKPARIQNQLDSMKDDFVTRMYYTILSALHYDKLNRKIIVRIHESGDFYNKAYAEKWLKIADLLKGENVTFICYTKSFRFFDGVKLPKKFKLRASIWADTPAGDLEIIKRNNWNVYTAVESFQKGDKFTRCRCKDCGTCQKCWRNYKDIRCEIH